MDIMKKNSEIETEKKKGIQMFDPTRHFKKNEYEYRKYINKVLHHGCFINGPEVQTLEKELARFVGVDHAIGVSSGTDALLVALMALKIGKGDEVITTPFTWISTAEVICLLGATPVFCDIDPQTFNIDPYSLRKCITEKTKAIIPVSLFGQTYDVGTLKSILNERMSEIPVIEDAAQSLGAKSVEGMSGSLGDISCTSFFPSKPLGCFGDGGMCFTNNKYLANEMRMIKNHGCLKRYQYERVGINGRLDTLQTAILLAKLPTFEESINKRQTIAERYNLAFESLFQISTPVIAGHCLRHVYAQYTILLPNQQCRDDLYQFLKNHSCGCGIFYPVCLHLVPAITKDYLPGSLPIAETCSKRCLSLPCYPELTEKEQEEIIKAIYYFFTKY
jgi:UDP-2-acetamido-2-deoxy-ribo-hexuluronate aminotransferase